VNEDWEGSGRAQNILFPFQDTAWDHGKPGTAGLRAEYELVKQYDIATLLKTRYMYYNRPKYRVFKIIY
jgi:hypothetical protein